ncbi:MAG: TIR domain-containing protein [Terracidiphilus sp.]
MAHDVFISHSAKDKTTADAVCAMLESEGIRCWIAPRDVVPGMEWSECIIEAIEQTRIMVLVFTADANASPQIRREVERAVNHGVAILPVRIENVMPARALEYFIGNVHWLDALTPPLEAHLKGLAGTIRILLERMGTRDEPMPHQAEGSLHQGIKPPEQPAPPQAATVGVPQVPEPPEPAVALEAEPRPAEAHAEEIAAQSTRTPEPAWIGPVARLEASEESGTRRSGEWHSGGGTVVRSRWKIPVWAWGGGVASALFLAMVLVGLHFFSDSGPAATPPAAAPPPEVPSSSPAPAQQGPLPATPPRAKAPSSSPAPAQPNPVQAAPTPQETPRSTLAPAQPSPLPAAPGVGASLADTMEFIQNALNGVGRVNFVVFQRNTSNGSSSQYTQSYEASNAVADPNQCRVSYR